MSFYLLSIFTWNIEFWSHRCLVITEISLTNDPDFQASMQLWKVWKSGIPFIANSDSYYKIYYQNGFIAFVKKRKKITPDVIKALNLEHFRSDPFPLFHFIQFSKFVFKNERWSHLFSCIDVPTLSAHIF